MKTIYKTRYRIIIQKLITIRKQKGITQQVLANKLQKAQSYIAKIEKYERKLDLIEFIEICEALGTSASELVREIE